jgi:hypothetical protein
MTVTGVVPRYTLSRYTSAPGGAEDTSTDPVAGVVTGVSFGAGVMQPAMRTRVMTRSEKNFPDIVRDNIFQALINFSGCPLGPG